MQYRSETKRALLPNEITSIDTVRALFVRSFPRQLTMAYLEGPNVKIYIHDASKDMFYELEDVRYVDLWLRARFFNANTGVFGAFFFINKSTCLRIENCAELENMVNFSGNLSISLEFFFLSLLTRISILHAAFLSRYHCVGCTLYILVISWIDSQ